MRGTEWPLDFLLGFFDMLVRQRAHPSRPARTEYSLPRFDEGCRGRVRGAAGAHAYSRLVLITDRHKAAHPALSQFESMLNDPYITERDFQRFFELHPEFLLRDEYDSYWAEPVINPLWINAQLDLILFYNLMQERQLIGTGRF